VIGGGFHGETICRGDSDGARVACCWRLCRREAVEGSEHFLRV
jgi:hypothetical protein